MDPSRHPPPTTLTIYKKPHAASFSPSPELTWRLFQLCRPSLPLLTSISVFVKEAESKKKTSHPQRGRVTLQKKLKKTDNLPEKRE